MGAKGSTFTEQERLTFGFDSPQNKGDDQEKEVKKFDGTGYDKDLVEALERDIISQNPNVKWLVGRTSDSSHASGAPGNVWMDVKLRVSLQGQHCRPGGSQEAPEGGRGAAHVDAGVLQRDQETLEGADHCTSHQTSFTLLISSFP